MFINFTQGKPQHAVYNIYALLSIANSTEFLREKSRFPTLFIKCGLDSLVLLQILIIRFQNWTG